MKYIKSPLNYTGGKYKILQSIFEIFPDNIETFVDLFAGGLNVGINVNAKVIIANDQISFLIELYDYLASNTIEDIISEIYKRIEVYNLSKINVDGYNALRDKYNESKNIIDFFVLTFYAFNHQIRFNNSHKFNTPFGKERSSYNDNIEKNLIRFYHALHEKNIQFSNKDFLDVDLSKLGPSDLVYCDPPYLISTGTYNDGNRGFKDWTEKEEKELLNLLDTLNRHKVKFVLSNVLYHKCLSNEMLIEWSKKYHVHYVNKSYANCSYHFKEKDAKTVEVLITNYESGCDSEWQQESLF